MLQSPQGDGALLWRDERPQGFGQGPAPKASRQDIVDDAELGHQVMLLVDRADASPQLSQASTREAFQVCGIEPEMPRSRAQRSVQQAKQGGLASSTRSNHGHTLTCLDVEGDVINRHCSVRKHLADLFQSIHGRSPSI